MTFDRVATLHLGLRSLDFNPRLLGCQAFKLALWLNRFLAVPPDFTDHSSYMAGTLGAQGGSNPLGLPFGQMARAHDQFSVTAGLSRPNFYLHLRYLCVSYN